MKSKILIVLFLITGFKLSLAQDCSISVSISERNPEIPEDTREHFSEDLAERLEHVLAEQGYGPILFLPPYSSNQQSKYDLTIKYHYPRFISTFETGLDFILSKKQDNGKYELITSDEWVSAGPRLLSTPRMRSKISLDWMYENLPACSSLI
jgi:hypothetical protein